MISSQSFNVNKKNVNEMLIFRGYKLYIGIKKHGSNKSYTKDFCDLKHNNKSADRAGCGGAA